MSKVTVLEASFYSWLLQRSIAQETNPIATPEEILFIDIHRVEYDRQPFSDPDAHTIKLKVFKNLADEVEHYRGILAQHHACIKSWNTFDQLWQDYLTDCHQDKVVKNQPAH